MNKISVADYGIKRLVDELFADFRYGQNCENPVTGAGYVHGVDPIEPQKEAACRALVAREWFAVYGPADAQPLDVNLRGPVGWRYRGLWGYIIHLYTRSFEDDFDIKLHPLFADYVSGVLWEAERVDGIIGKLPSYPDELLKLKKRFPPKELVGMGPGFCWLTPKEYAETMPSYRRSITRGAGLDSKVRRTVSINTRTTHLTPITEIVKIPEAVRRAAAAVLADYQQQKSHAQPES